MSKAAGHRDIREGIFVSNCENQEVESDHQGSREQLMKQAGSPSQREFLMEGTARTPRIGLSPEDCASCNGHGIGSDQNPCCACNGKGKDLVVQPSTRCPWCRGTWQPESASLWHVDHCVICLGTGWVWTEFHLAERPERS